MFYRVMYVNGLCSDVAFGDAKQRACLLPYNIRPLYDSYIIRPLTTHKLYVHYTNHILYVHHTNHKLYVHYTNIRTPTFLSKLKRDTPKH